MAAGHHSHRSDASHRAPRAETASFTSQATNRGSNSRAGWYGDQTRLSPALVGNSAAFGQIWKQPSIKGNVYAQPLVADGVLVIATEQDNIYGLNPSTGTVEWSENVGSPLQEQNTWQCGDISPYVGITSTPTFDVSTNSLYFVALEMSYNGTPNYYLHAINPLSGVEQPNFPVLIQGQATNNQSPNGYFDADLLFQRPGLLLLNNTVYVGFGSHCDVGAWNGFLVGVSTSGTTADQGTGIDTIWDAITSGDPNGDAGIWQSGGGIVQYGDNILLTTGNGDGQNDPGAPTSATDWIQNNGSVPSSVVDLSVSSLGSDALQSKQLNVSDFFMPYNEQALSDADLDFGSGSPIPLPSSFGTTNYPNVILQDGKAGCVYLLDGPTASNPNTLGGFGQGPGGGDAVIGAGSNFNQGVGDKLCQAGGAWATPAVLPTATGGYIYIPTATNGTGSLGNSGQGNFYAYKVDASSTQYNFPTISQVATAGPVAGINNTPTSIQFGFGSSSPITTSNQLVPGTGIVWIVRSLDPAGDGGTLQAYNAVPNGKWLTLIGQWSVGMANKFTSPGVWDNKLFVASKTGTVYAFGALTQPAIVDTQSVNFKTTIVGGAPTTMTTTVTTVNAPSTGITVTGISTTPSSVFSATAIVGGVAEPIPSGGITLLSGQSLKVAITFAPLPGTAPGAQVGVVSITDNYGEFDLPVSGTAESSQGVLYASTRAIDFGGITQGNSSPTATFILANYGATPLTWTAVPAAKSTPPFTLSSLPSTGATLAPNSSVTISVVFKPTDVGESDGSITFSAKPTGTTTVQSLTILLTGSGAEPAQVQVSPATVASNGNYSTVLNFGQVPIGQSSTLSFSVMNNVDAAAGSTATVTNFTPAIVSDPVANDTLHNDLQIQASLAVGEEFEPQSSATFPVVFQPSTNGVFTTVWKFTTDEKNAAGTGFVTFTITMTGQGTGTGYAIPIPTPTDGWTANGAATLAQNSIQLTPNLNSEAGTSFWPTAQSSKTMNISYTSLASDGSGADAQELVLANAADTTPTTVGNSGFDLGIGGMDAISVVVAEYPENGAPAGSFLSGFVGIADGINQANNGMNWLKTAVIPTGGTVNDGGVQDVPLDVNVSVTTSPTGTKTISVTINGQGVVPTDNTDTTYTPLTANVTGLLANSVLLGFGGATGGLDDQHTVSNVWATVSGSLPNLNLSSSYNTNVGVVPVGGYTNDTVTLTNTSNNRVDLTKVATTGAGLSVITTSNGLTGVGYANPTLPLLLLPGDYVQVLVGVQPTAAGPIRGSLLLSYLGAQSQSLPITGTASGPATPTASYTTWHRNGSATLVGSTLKLNSGGTNQAGSAWNTTLNKSASTTVTFTPVVPSTSVADGFALLYGSSKTPATFVGGSGFNMGFAPNSTGVIAVVFSEYAEAGSPGANFVGISNGSVGTRLRWLSTALLPTALSSLSGPITVVSTATSLTVYVSGIRVLKTTVALPATPRLGFSGSSGGLTGSHGVSGVTITQA